MKVKEVMKNSKGKRQDLTVNEDESIDNAALLMKDRKSESIQVINDEGQVVGIITKESLIEASDDLNEDFFIN